MTIPTMYPEIVDAINEYFKNDEAIRADCLLFLAHIDEIDKEVVDRMGGACFCELENMGRCVECGEKLVDYQYKVTHWGIEGNPVEKCSITLCPNCEMGELM